jgi:hypothetical protein
MTLLSCLFAEPPGSYSRNCSLKREIFIPGSTLDLAMAR